MSEPRKKRSARQAPAASEAARAAPEAAAEANPADEGGGYTLAALEARLGAATDAEVAAYAEDVDRDACIDDGRQVETPRVDAECARIYGVAADFFQRAAGDLATRVRGASQRTVRVGVTAARRGRGLYDHFEGERKARKTAATASAVDAEQVRAEALTERAQLVEALRTAVGGSRKGEKKLREALGTVQEAGKLADSLDALVALGRDLRKKRSAARALRIEDAGLTAEWLDACGVLAGRVRAVVGGAEAPKRKRGVTQAEVDYWDGFNLYLLGRVIRAFEAAHARDARVPRLVPNVLGALLGTRRGRAKKARKADADAKKPDATKKGDEAKKGDTAGRKDAAPDAKHPET